MAAWEFLAVVTVFQRLLLWRRGSEAACGTVVWVVPSAGSSAMEWLAGGGVEVGLFANFLERGGFGAPSGSGLLVVRDIVEEFVVRVC